MPGCNPDVKQLARPGSAPDPVPPAAAVHFSTADGEWRAEFKQGATYLPRNVAVAAAASHAAKELHEDLFTPIDEIIEEARSQQAAKVAALEAEPEAARRTPADLD